MTDAMFGVDGSVVVITGGAGKLGGRFGAELLRRGARVVLVDLPAAIERRLPDPVEASSPERLMVVPADVTSRASLECALDAVSRRWGPPTGLVNNAAIDSPPGAPASENGPFETYPEDSWDRVVAVNLKGPFLCCQVFGGAMAAAGRGSIVNISSIYGMVSPDQRIYEYRRQSGDEFVKPVAYAVTKSGILNLTRYLATYWAAQGVRVNTLSFGGVFDDQDQRFVAAYSSRVPIGRMARRDEYRGALVFLLSEASSYMTGANLVLDGGWTAW